MTAATTAPVMAGVDGAAMPSLAEIADHVPRCLLAAWVEPRTATVLEQHVVHGDPRVALALDVTTEVMRSSERPPRMVLLSADHVLIVQRAAHDPQRALVVICARSANLGFAVALVRMFADARVT